MSMELEPPRIKHGFLLLTGSAGTLFVTTTQMGLEGDTGR